MKRLSRLAVILAFTLVVAHPDMARAWGSGGHRIVAYIAADNLAPAARRHVAALLGISYRSRAVGRAMAAISVLPDRKFREEAPATIPWHFINLCLQDRPNNIPARCAGECVSAKINEYARRLRTGNYDRWGARGDLAFLIHFVGDIYQPLHAANDADQGGNCISISSPPHIRNLHSLWDVTLVRVLERNLDSGRPRTTARRLQTLYAQERNSVVWGPDTADRIAWQSTMVARSQVYRALNIPVEPCQPEIHSCRDAPRIELELSPAYISHASTIAGEQLARAGFALASLLNTIWR